MPTHNDTTDDSTEAIATTVALRLSDKTGRYTGQTRTITIERPTHDQFMWAQTALMRLQMIMDAVASGEEIDPEERAETATQIFLLIKMCTNTRGAALIDDIFSSGKIQMADMWSAIIEAFHALGITTDADVVIKG